MPQAITEKPTDEWMAWAKKHHEADLVIEKAKMFSGDRADAIKAKESIEPAPPMYKE